MNDYIRLLNKSLNLLNELFARLNGDDDDEDEDVFVVCSESSSVRSRCLQDVNNIH